MGSPTGLPQNTSIYSSFDQGHDIYSEGEQVLNTHWNNISLQSFQAIMWLGIYIIMQNLETVILSAFSRGKRNRVPFIEYSDDSTQPIQVSINFKEASFNGGGNLTLTGSLGHDAEFATRLFRADHLLGISPVYFTYSVKSSGNSLLGLALAFSSPTQENTSVLLAATGDALLTMKQFSSHFTSVIMPHRVTELEHKPGWIIQESRIAMPGSVLKEIRALCYRSKHKQADAVAADNALPHGPSDYHAVLGDIKITTFGGNSKFPPSNAWVVESESISWSSGSQGSKKLGVKIVWQLKGGHSEFFPRYNIYVEKLTNSSNRLLEEASKFLGVAVVKSFYVSELEVPSGTSGLKFIIQVYGLDGAVQELGDSPFLKLQVEG